MYHFVVECDNSNIFFVKLEIVFVSVKYENPNISHVNCDPGPSTHVSTNTTGCALIFLCEELLQRGAETYEQPLPKHKNIPFRHVTMI